MKYRSHFYAKALAAAIAEGKGKNDAVIIRNFLAMVRRNGDEAHFSEIIEQAAGLVRKDEGIRKVTVESARPLTKPVKTLLKDFLKPGDVVEEKIHAELVAGLRITIDDELQFDGSLKGKMDKLFADI